MISLNSQPFDHASIFEVLFNDLVNVFFIHIRVPDIFRINHNNRTFITTVKASRIVDPYSLALAVESQRLDTLLGVIAYGLGTMIVTAHCSRFSLVDAEKNMPLVVAHKSV